MDGQSFDIKYSNLEKWRELFPNIFSEGKIDLEKFKAAFCDDRGKRKFILVQLPGNGACPIVGLVELMMN